MNPDRAGVWRYGTDTLAVSSVTLHSEPVGSENVQVQTPALVFVSWTRRLMPAFHVTAVTAAMVNTGCDHPFSTRIGAETVTTPHLGCCHSFVLFDTHLMCSSLNFCLPAGSWLHC